MNARKSDDIYNANMKVLSDILEQSGSPESITRRLVSHSEFKVLAQLGPHIFTEFLKLRKNGKGEYSNAAYIVPLLVANISERDGLGYESGNNGIGFLKAGLDYTFRWLDDYVRNNKLDK